MYMYYSHLFSAAYAGHLLYIYIHIHISRCTTFLIIYFGVAEIAILRHTHVCSPNPSESSTPEGTKEIVTAAPAMRFVCMKGNVIPQTMELPAEKKGPNGVASNILNLHPILGPAQLESLKFLGLKI